MHLTLQSNTMCAQREKIYRKSLLAKHFEYHESTHCQAHFSLPTFFFFFNLCAITCMSYKMTQGSFRGCSFMCRNQTWHHLFQQYIPQCWHLSMELHQQHICNRQHKLLWNIKIKLYSLKFGKHPWIAGQSNPFLQGPNDTQSGQTTPVPLHFSVTEKKTLLF